MLNVLAGNLPYLLKGAAITLWLALAVVTAGTALGIALGILAAVGGRALRAAITGYIFVLRGIPVLVVMFLGYYAFPALGFRVNAYVAVGIAQTIYVGAFAAEIVRSAILSVPRGQVDAARSLGLRTWPILRKVVLPQATRIAIPPLLNNALTAVKQTSYASVVGAWELTYAAREVVGRPRVGEAHRRTEQPRHLRVVAAGVRGAGGGIGLGMTGHHERVQLTQHRERGPVARASRQVRAHALELQRSARAFRREAHVADRLPAERELIEFEKRVGIGFRR